MLGLLVFAWMSLTTFMTRSQIPYLPQPTQGVSGYTVADVLGRTWLALQNRNFRLLFVSTLLTAAVAGTGQVFDIYMNLYFWEFSTEDIRWFSLSVIGAVASFLTAGWLQRFYDKHQIMAASVFAITLLAMIKVLFRFWGIWPENGDPALLWMFVAHVSLAAYTGSMILIMFASMMADIVDEQEYATGLRQEGIYSAGISFAAKATSALGLFLGGLLLDLVIRLPRGAAPGAIADDTLFRLAFVDGIAVPVFNFIALFLILKYSLTRDKLHAIQQSLHRRAAGGR